MSNVMVTGSVRSVVVHSSQSVVADTTGETNCNEELRGTSTDDMFL